MTYSVFPVYGENGQLIGASLIFRDNTPPVATFRSRDISMYLEPGSLLDHLAEGVFTINNNWRITSFNQRAEEITGFTREEVLGSNCWDIFRSDLCRTGCPLKATYETGVIHMDQDVRIVGKHSRRLTILVNTSVLKDRHEAVIGAIETFRPLTEPGKSPFKMEGLEETGYKGEPIVGQGPGMARLLGMLPDVAASEASVVLEGESGTGKELFARAIHAQSPRADGPFVAVNCSALAESLLESELFGHEKAAFTGASSSRAGRFELARGGTLFLDEISEIKPEIQVKLLRVLEEKVFERVGGTRPIIMDARIISATNRNLIQEVRAGRFRQDLFYRLRTVPLYLPALRERLEDMPQLVSHFISRFNDKSNKRVRGLDPKAMGMFRKYHWPGNVRELQRVLEYAFVFVKGPVITPAHLPEFESQPAKSSEQAPAGPGFWEDERLAIERALAKTGGRRLEAARLLGISRSSLWRKMKVLGLEG